MWRPRFEPRAAKKNTSDMPSFALIFCLYISVHRRLGEEISWRGCLSVSGKSKATGLLFVRPPIDRNAELSEISCPSCLGLGLGLISSRSQIQLTRNHRHREGIGPKMGRSAVEEEIAQTYTGCPGGNVPDLGRMFLTLKYTDLTQNTYIRS